MTERDLADELVALACSAAPFEACGIVLHDWSWIELDNVAQDPTRNFEFSDKDLLHYFGLRMDLVLGVFHTHPRGTSEPSAADSEFPYDLRYFIATTEGMYEWAFRSSGAVPVGEPYLAHKVPHATAEVRPDAGNVAEDGGCGCGFCPCQFA